MENGIAALFILFCICLIVTMFTKANSGFFIYCLGGTCGLLISLIVIVNTYDCTPTPMDVYQGKTTLEYTIVDGVKVDSCVIWKNKEG